MVSAVSQSLNQLSDYPITNSPIQKRVTVTDDPSSTTL
jgi:hypothetical protein